MKNDTWDSLGLCQQDFDRCKVCHEKLPESSMDYFWVKGSNDRIHLCSDKCFIGYLGYPKHDA